MAGFTAGTISYHGLVKFFGVTAERQSGVMIVPNLTDWQKRTVNAVSKPWNTTVPPGPTYISGGDGSTVGTEWWHVWNYLNYNVGGVVVGGTGTVSYTASNVEYTPLHESSERINAFFDTGNTYSSTAIANIAQSRKDCFGIVGNTKPLGLPINDSYGSTLSADFGVTGFTGIDGTNVIYVANRKQFFKDWNSSGSSIGLETALINLSSDVAGCLGRAFATNNAWSSPAGINRGIINGVISLEQNYTSNDQTNLVNSGVSPVVSFPGRGNFLMGNSTGASSFTGAGSRSNIHIVSLLNYVKTVVKDIAYDYMFEPNNEANRSQFITRASSLLESVRVSGSISQYNIVCNAADNQGITFTADIYLTPVNLSETLVLRVTNNGTTPAEVFEV
jgi:hypothetical protein